MVSGILDKVISHTYQESRQVNFSELVGELFKSLNSREIEILKERYGLFDGKASTLEVIGKKHNITRERVRQIERGAIHKIKFSKNFEFLVRGFRMSVIQNLMSKGGLASETDIIKEFYEENQESSNMLIFLIKLLEPEYLEEIKLDNVNKSWMIKNVSLDRFNEIISEVKKILEEHKQPLLINGLLELFKKTDYYQKHNTEFNLGMLNTLSEDSFRDDKDFVLKSVLNSYINISQIITINPFGEIGLNSWHSIAPKRMCEKIYLILKHAGKPMHFRDITKAINEAHFDKKIAHTPTIHNELILDNRFVLIGRGIYALKEWGYKNGVVIEIIEEILKKSGQPMSKKSIYEAVKQQRIVKDGTIYLALNNREKFIKNSEGLYWLNEAKVLDTEPESVIKDLGENNP